MMKNDNADKNQPFVLRSTVGNFLNSVTFFYMCLALGFALFGPLTFANNSSVSTVLLKAIIIQSLLALNSRLFFSIFAFLTFGSILIQILTASYFIFTTDMFQGMPMLSVIIASLCLVGVFTFMIGIEVFCSAAFLKLSGVVEHPTPQKPKRRRHKRRSASVEDGTTEKSEAPTKTPFTLPSMTPCSHAPTCSSSSSRSTRTTK